jgi:poly-gamma-glutamate capsule biosynthesis protein CapA/YwtB (metallophosphatase superfamily)
MNADLRTVFLGGDVMTGRGVDQILPSPGDPRLWERYVDDARDYVELAERANGPVPRPVPLGWPWGDALPLLDDLAPDARIVNLETSITARGLPAPGKGVHYRMHPGNVECLTVAGLDACSLANNHVLDFGADGLADTLGALATARLPVAGAGAGIEAARRPAVAGGVVLAACAETGSGVPRSWAASSQRPGVHLLPDLRTATADDVANRATAAARDGDLVVVSIHWGPNWGYDVPRKHVEFAHRLIDAGIHVVHGHSAHHPLPIEIYRGRLILYGCGDLIDDYEGILGHEEYRDDLRLLYLPTIDVGDGRLTALRIVPMQARRLQLRHASPVDVEWLRDLLAGLSGREVRIDADGLLAVPC